MALQKTRNAYLGTVPLQARICNCFAPPSQSQQSPCSNLGIRFRGNINKARNAPSRHSKTWSPRTGAVGAPCGPEPTETARQAEKSRGRGRRARQGKVLRRRTTRPRNSQVHRSVERGTAKPSWSFGSGSKQRSNRRSSRFGDSRKPFSALARPFWGSPTPCSSPTRPSPTPH